MKAHDAFIQALRQHRGGVFGYTSGLYQRHSQRMLRALKLDKILTSERVVDVMRAIDAGGIFKPSAAAYKMACRLCRNTGPVLTSSRTIFFDDKPVNLSGSKITHEGGPQGAGAVTVWTNYAHKTWEEVVAETKKKDPNAILVKPDFMVQSLDELTMFIGILNTGRWPNEFSMKRREHNQNFYPYRGQHNSELKRHWASLKPA